ncbi:MAG: hypothetical protein IIB25_09485 [Chloroflexi bacterium]|nr:hypothetical protein [Chloroflexota bacterium]
MRLKILVASAICCVATAASAQRATIDPGEVFDITGVPVEGTGAMITRTDRGVSFMVMTTDLTPGDAFSVWVVIVEPKVNNIVDVFVFNIAGGMANANGDLNFGAHVSTGTVPEANGLNIFVGGGEFDHPRDAAIHLVIRTHGPVIPGMQMAQFGTLNGGCNPGEPNEGLCEDMQRVFY